MVRRQFLPLLAACTLLSSAAYSGDGFEDFSELDLESLLDQVVVTASKRAEKLNEAPVATYVVTAEDIQSSGAASIPDALRMVPGLEVMSPNVTNANVSARGLNEIGANTMMVLINGRSVYAEFLGVVFWDMLPIDVSDIKSIEVTRSPGSALYGANAFAGVINIITYDPGETDEVAINTSASEYGSTRATAAVSGSHGERFSYRLSTGYQHVEHPDPVGTQGYAPRINADLRWDLDESSWAASAGYAGGRSRSIPTSLGSAIWIDGDHSFARADYSRSGNRVRAYWSSFDVDLVPESSTPETPLTDLRTDTIDLEFLRIQDLGDAHTISWAASYRHNLIDWAILPENYTQALYGVAVNDEWRIAPGWIAAGGARYDHHPLTKGSVSPRASLVFSPHPYHSLRALVSRAHRSPTYLESYFRFEGSSSIPGYPVQLNGNTDLRPEQITAYEVGYQGLLDKELLATADFFHNRMRDSVDILLVDTYPAPPAPFPGIPREYRFLNDRNLDSTGGELGLAWTPTSRIRVRANYAYTWIENSDTGRRVETAPRYKANLGLTIRPASAISVHAAARYVGRTEFTIVRDQALVTEGAGDYVVTDLRVGFEALPQRLDVAVGVHNALDRRYREHAEGIQFRRSFFATVGVRF